MPNTKQVYSLLETSTHFIFDDRRTMKVMSLFPQHIIHHLQVLDVMVRGRQHLNVLFPHRYSHHIASFFQTDGQTLCAYYKKLLGVFVQISKHKQPNQEFDDRFMWHQTISAHYAKSNVDVKCALVSVVHPPNSRHHSSQGNESKLKVAWEGTFGVYSMRWNLLCK